MHYSWKGQCRSLGRNHHHCNTFRDPLEFIIGDSRIFIGGPKIFVGDHNIFIWDPIFGNRQKSPWKKSFRKKVLKFHTKKSFFKKSPEIKSYQFETLFSRTFFWLQFDFMQKSPLKKSPLTSENAWFTMLGFSFPRIYFLQGSYFLRLYW